MEKIITIILFHTFNEIAAQLLRKIKMKKVFLTILNSLLQENKIGAAESLNFLKENVRRLK